MQRFVLACMVVLTACGDDGADGPRTIEIQRYEGYSVDVLAFRDGDAPWQTLAPEATSFVVESGRYTLAGSCSLSIDGMQYLYLNTMLSRTVDDAAPPIPCATQDIRDVVGEHLVEITMAEPGEIYFAGDRAKGTTADWTTTVEVPSGMHALVAFDATRIAVQRDVAITGPTTLPKLSLASAAAFRTQTFTLDGLDGEDVSWQSELMVDRSWAWRAQGNGLAIPVAPAEVLVDDDDRAIYLFTESRYVFLTDYSESLGDTIELMPKLTGVTRAGRVVSFGALPDYEYLSSIAGDAMASELAIASRSYVEAAGLTSLALDFTGVPGFDASRLVAPGDTFQSFAANIDVSDTYFLESYVSFP